MLRSFTFVVCFLILSVAASAQTTHITGRVYNASANEPMPFVSMLAIGTTTGTVSDIDGYYDFSVIGHVDSIRAVYVGFHSTTLKVQQGQEQVINIPMNINTSDLPPVEILPGENPAVTILKLV